MQKNKVLTALKIIIILLLVGIIAFSAYKLISIQLEYKQGENTFNELANTVVKKPEKHEGNSDGSHGSSPDIEIDFEALKAFNKDVVAWVMLEDTVLNYPIVQGRDNKYYLKHMIDHNYNNCGTIFLDVNNKRDFSDGHSFIYGHNMHNGTMFACLTNYSKQSFYENHKELILFLPDKTYKLVPFSAYPTNGSDMKTYDYDNKNDVESYFDYAKKRSQFISDIEFEEGDRILTLSTCEYNRNDGRYVLHCLIREYE